MKLSLNIFCQNISVHFLFFIEFIKLSKAGEKSKHMCKIMLLCQSSQQHLVIDFRLSILDNKWELNYNLT